MTYRQTSRLTTAESQAIDAGAEAVAALQAAYDLRLEYFFRTMQAARLASGRTLAQRAADAATFVLDAGLMKAVDELPRLRLSRAAFERLPVFDLDPRRKLPDHAARIPFGDVWMVWRKSLAAGYMLYRPTVPKPKRSAISRDRKFS
jgi:hypothetical protein